jgi:hypothetical protein
MEHIRIGNDIVIRWSIFAGDAAYDLEGRDIAFFLKTVYGRCRITDYSVEGNAIKWTFYGKDQKAECAYGLELVENDGEKGMYTVDECDAFRLVGSCHECGCGEPEENVEVVSLQLKTVVTFPGGGGPPVEIVDDLDSDRTDAALSANQGRELNERIESTQKEVSTLNADATVPGSVDYKIAKVQMGGVDPSGLVSKEELIEDEDIASAALAELSSRIDSQVASLKRTTSQNLISQVEKLRSSLNDIIIEDEDVVAAALAEQNQRIDSKTDRLERVKATRNELAVQVESIFSTILENEDIISAALAEINSRIAHIEEVLRTIKSNAL